MSTLAHNATSDEPVDVTSAIYLNNDTAATSTTVITEDDVS